MKLSLGKHSDQAKMDSSGLGDNLSPKESWGSRAKGSRDH